MARNHFFFSSFSLFEKAAEKHKIALANEIQPKEETFCTRIIVSFERELSGL
jgi:hypothetical protein